MVTGPALLAIPVYVILLLLINVNHNPFITEVVEQIIQDEKKSQVFTYRDLNNDGISEQILVYNLPTNATIIGYNQNGTIFESWNLYGHYSSRPVFDFNDINKDGIQEMYAITVTPDDSLFVNQAKLLQRSNNARNTFVAKLDRFNNQVDYLIEGLGFSDINGDSIPEYIFAVCAGFTLQPRAVYAWDIKKDQIVRSPLSGMAVKYNDALNAADLNHDGIRELFFSNSATDNYKTTVPFSDTASYSMVLTKNLEFLYSPVLMAGPSSASYSFPLLVNDTNYILTLTTKIRGKGNDGKAILFDVYGNKKDSALLQNMNTQIKYHSVNGRIIFVRWEDGETIVGTIENDLSVKERMRFIGRASGLMPADLDNDPEMEMVMLDTREGNLYILQDNLNTYSSCAIPSELSYLIRTGIAEKTDTETRFLMQMNNYRMMVSYRDNPFYKWRFVYYLLLYCTIYLVLYLLQKVFLFRSNRKKAKEDRMISLQLQSVMNQINPHFTFNAINTVGDSILNDRKHEAYENLTKLSGLIRSSMDNAFQVYKSLGEEIGFTRQYLELESVRFESKLTYSFNIHSNVDLEMKVPKMLLHLFVENAIKHGIFHKTSRGHISVTATREQQETVISISDDGIGRKKAHAISGDKGKGLLILNDYLVLFGKNYQREISYTIKDLYDRDENPGTRVTIRIKH